MRFYKLSAAAIQKCGSNVSVGGGGRRSGSFYNLVFNNICIIGVDLASRLVRSQYIHTYYIDRCVSQCVKIYVLFVFVFVAVVYIYI